MRHRSSLGERGAGHLTLAEGPKAAEGGDARPSPDPIIRLCTAYWGSQTLFTANRLGLFETLSQGPMTSADVASALRADPHRIRLLLKACVALGLMEENPDGFGNSALSEAFLVPGKPGYLGNAIRYGDDMYGPWAEIEQAIRSGKPTVPAAAYLGGDAAKTRHFVHGMHERALGIGQALIEMVDLSGRRQMLDLGGGPGTYSALFTQRYPGLKSTVLDLPDVTSLASEILASMGAENSVEVIAGDYQTSAFPPGNDVVLISGVFHRETEATCRGLIAKSAESLQQGGLLLVSDVFADAGGTSPAFAALFGLNMALSAQSGGVHADQDVLGWIESAGFHDAECRAFPPPLPHRLVIGRKG